MSSPAKEQLVRRMAQAEQMRTVFGKTVVDDFEVYIGFATSPGEQNCSPDDVKPDGQEESLADLVAATIKHLGETPFVPLGGERILINLNHPEPDDAGVKPDHEIEVRDGE